MFFFLFAALVIYLTGKDFNDAHWIGCAAVICLLVSILLHELGHVIVAKRLGGVADEIVIGPVGGLQPVRVPYEPHSELVALMAGTLVNAAICFLCAIGLTFLSPETSLVALLQPRPSVIRHEAIAESGMAMAALISVLALTFWINWCLILINLIPAFPFDGGRSLHAVLTFLWPEYDARQSHVAICRLGKIIAAVLLVLAWLRFDPAPLNNPFALTLLSIYIFFFSRREEIQQAETDHDDDTVFGYDFSQGYTSLERSLEDEEDVEDQTPHEPKLSLLGMWLENRREVQRQRQIEQDTEDDRRVDEVLARLHDGGMRSLSPEDKALLERVSKRYRSRQS